MPTAFCLTFSDCGNVIGFKTTYGGFFVLRNEIMQIANKIPMKPLIK